VERSAGLGALWSRLARPYDPVGVLEALLGFTHGAARQLVGVIIATSPEAEELLDGMPHMLRGLAIATTDRPVRCYAEIRGPVMWAETAAARASSAGDPGLFVCATPDKAFDTDENRVLVSALAAVRRAGREAEHISDEFDDAVLRHARHNGARAVQFLQHRTLAAVPRRHRPTPRALHRTRAGTRRRTYQPALDLIGRMNEPFTLAALTDMSDERTTAQHDLFAALIAGLETRGHSPPSLHVNEGSIVAGPLSYRHERSRGDLDHVHGVLVGGVLVDVPDEIGSPDRTSAADALAARAHGHPSVVVLESAHIDEALDLAIDLGLRRSKS
jgi:hypothetical protein